METPWNKYPNLWPSSSQWRKGESSEYIQDWVKFYKELKPEEQKAYRKENKAPFYWFDFYIHQDENATSWVMPMLFLETISAPLRYIHFKIKQ